MSGVSTAATGSAGAAQRFRRRRGALQLDRDGGPLAQDLAVQRLGLGLGLGIELALERADAELVLAERRASAAELHVQPHQRAVHRLLERIEGEELERGLHGRLRRPRRPMPGEEPGQGLHRGLAQALALGQEPLLERRLLQRQARQEVALVQQPGLVERAGRPLGDEGLEDLRVDGHRLGVERHCVAVEPEGVGSGQGLPERGQRLAQAAAGLRRLHVAPEQGGQLVPGVGLAGGHREIGQQRL